MAVINRRTHLTLCRLAAAAKLYFFTYFSNDMSHDIPSLKQPRDNICILLLSFGPTGQISLGWPWVDVIAA